MHEDSRHSSNVIHQMTIVLKCWGNCSGKQLGKLTPLHGQEEAEILRQLNTALVDKIQECQAEIVAADQEFEEGLKRSCLAPAYVFIYMLSPGCCLKLVAGNVTIRNLTNIDKCVRARDMFFFFNFSHPMQS